MAEATPNARGAPDERPRVEGEAPSADGVRPGAVSALLDELARAPGSDRGWGNSYRAGVRVGRFELLREIGRGGFGVVFEARDGDLGRLVAFKAVRPGNRSAEQLRERWLRQEAEAAAQLNHPNIVTLHELGRSDAGPYLVLEMLHGETLADRLRRGPLPLREAVDVAVEVARAIAHAHAGGVLHRDLKPSNVFLAEQGGVKVLDFGLAHVFGTTGLRGGGTPAYMAPEQWREEPEDARTDVYSAAVMLHESLAGALPFPVPRDGAGPPAAGPPPPPPGAPRELATLLVAALSPDPAPRPRSGRAWLDALLAVQRDLVASTAGTPRPRWAVAAAVLLALGAAAAAGLAVRSRRVATPSPGGRITVVVADFANATDDRDLSGLSGMLITSLEQSRRLAVLSRSRMFDLLRQLGHGGAENIDEPLAREIGRRAGARALLLASIRRFGEVYAVELKALDPLADEYLFTVQEQARGKESIPGLIDRLSERAREALREHASDIRASQVSVGEAITRNLEAYRHYFLGQQCMNRFIFGSDCAVEFEKAIAIDPDFALAHLQLAMQLGDEPNPIADQRAALAGALRRVDRLPEKERLQILAWKAYLDGDVDGALRTYERLELSFPDDKTAFEVAGSMLTNLKGDVEAAVPQYERARALDPAFGRPVEGLVQAWGLLGRNDELRDNARRWAEGPPSPLALGVLSQAHGWLGDAEAAIAAARREVEVGGGAAAAQDLVAALNFAGRYEEVEAMMRRMAGPAAPAATRPFGTYALAAALLYQGRWREALAEIRNLPEGARRPVDRVLQPYLAAELLAGRGATEPVWREVAQVLELYPLAASAFAPQFAFWGDLPRARRLARHLVPGSADEELYRALVRRAKGDRAGAIADLRALVERGGADSRFTAAYLLGEAFAEAGDDAGAVEAMRRFQSQYSLTILVWRGWAYPRSLYLVARSHERLGNRNEARREIDQLLAMWRRADPDLPLLREARELRARLGP